MCLLRYLQATCTAEGSDNSLYVTLWDKVQLTACRVSEEGRITGNYTLFIQDVMDYNELYSV